jgi:hypothetical protein
MRNQILLEVMSLGRDLALQSCKIFVLPALRGIPGAIFFTMMKAFRQPRLSDQETAF